MSLKTWITGINPQKAFDTISNGVDKLAFTKEERADLNLKLADKVAEFAEKTMSESTIRSKSRRLISYVVVFMYVLCLIGALFFESDMLVYIVKDSSLNTAFIMVLAFFFGGYYMKQIQINKKKD